MAVNQKLMRVVSLIVARIAQCSSEHMACIFRFGLVRFTDLFKVFESYFQFPFQKIAPYL